MFKRKASPLSSVLIAVLILSLVVNIVLSIAVFTKNNHHHGASEMDAALIKPVSAQEMYPLFRCPCCDKPISVRCCGMAEQRINYVDALVDAGLSKREIHLKMVKKFGLSTLMDESKQQEIKQQMIDSAPDDRPQIVIEPMVYDFGQVSQAGGETSATVILKNTGKTDLTINEMSSSCGCTSAAIIYKGQEGPKFTMPGHGYENPTDWSVSIAPGDEAQLKIYYDPNMHGEFRGAVTRTVTIYSNDPIDFEKKVKIELEQVQ